MKENERILGNDDAPIVIGDTSIPFQLMGAPTKDETTVTHQAPPGNADHYHKNAKNHFYVHDKENGNGKDYRAVCFDFASLSQSIPIPADATSWEISFKDKYGNQVFSLNWVAELINEKDSGDVTLDADGATQNGMEVTMGVRVATMAWCIDEGPFSGPILPKDKALVTVHYCPNGKCKVNPCK
jgi:hypothetical protein